MQFLVYAAAVFCGLVIDPVIWLPTIVVAYWKPRPWWLPVAVGAAFALADDFVVRAVTSGGYDGHLQVQRVMTGAVFGLIVIGARALLRRFRRNPFT